MASAKAAIDRQQALVEPLYVAPYTLPDTSPNPEATAQDTIRRSLFTLAAAIMAVVSILGIGELVSGSVPGHDTLLSLAPAAYTLVPVIACWSLAAALYAWRPSQSSAVRQRAVGRTFPLALAASALWLVSVNAGSLFLAFCAATLTAGLLLVTVRELNSHTARSDHGTHAHRRPGWADGRFLPGGVGLVALPSSCSPGTCSCSLTSLPV